MAALSGEYLWWKAEEMEGQFGLTDAEGVNPRETPTDAVVDQAKRSRNGLQVRATHRRRGLGHLDAGPTDHSEGISASYRKGQVRAEMTWHIIAATEKSGGVRVAGGMSKMAKRELLATIQDRYRVSSTNDKTRILDEFLAVTGHHRKHAIRLL